MKITKCLLALLLAFMLTFAGFSAMADTAPAAQTDSVVVEAADDLDDTQLVESTNNPKTGDDRLTKVFIFGGVALLAVAAIVVCVVLPAAQKKKKDNSEEE